VSAETARGERDDKGVEGRMSLEVDNNMNYMI
jgi:hypothetical protein